MAFHRITRTNKYVPDMGSSLSGFASKLAGGAGQRREEQVRRRRRGGGAGRSEGREDIEGEGKRDYAQRAPRRRERERQPKDRENHSRSDQTIRRAAGPSGAYKTRRAKKSDLICTDGHQQSLMMGGEGCVAPPLCSRFPIDFFDFRFRGVIAGQIATWGACHQAYGGRPKSKKDQ